MNHIPPDTIGRNIKKAELPDPRDVAEKWRLQHEKSDGTWKSCVRGTGDDVHRRLTRLGKDPSREKIEEVIGNGSWTRAFCTGCQEPVDEAVAFGYEDAATVCRHCLIHALSILGE
jgi:hypothetical protein